MIVDEGFAPRVALAVVSLGTSTHLEACLASLAAHESRVDFAVIWVRNSPGVLAKEDDIAVPTPIQVIALDTNLGWAGGLHVARAATTAEFLVWVQEDMEVFEGWVDALVHAADENPHISAFGSVAINSTGNPAGFAGGMALPSDDVGRWNDTDTTARSLPEGVTEFDWVTSKGMLTRLSAWDEIGGADPRLFPLNHVDKDYCTHLRAHGYGVALVPTARLFHIGSASAPGLFREFVAHWQEPRFNVRWAGVVEAMQIHSDPVAHDCRPWLAPSNRRDYLLDSVRHSAGAEAADMVVPLARWMAERVRQLGEENAGILRSFTTSRSWRITAPLRALSALGAKLRHRSQSPRVARKSSPSPVTVSGPSPAEM